MPDDSGEDRPGPNPLWFWLFAALFLVLQRLPVLLSRNRILDGDEAIVGLMAKRISEGSEFPLFFWGQSYGLSILEALPAGIAFRILGPSSMLLSLTVLGLFFMGLVFWEAAFRRLVGDLRWSRLLALGLGLLPIWVTWSMKARGGYITAFVLSGLLARWLCGSNVDRGRAVVIGAVGAVLFFSQPVWFLPVLPLLGLPILGRGEKDPPRPGPILGSAAAGFAIGFLPFLLVASTRRAFWRPDLVGFELGANLLSAPSLLLNAMTGAFYLEDSWAPPWPVSVLGIGLALAVPFTLGLLIHRALGRRDPSAALLALSLLSALAGLAFLRELPPRYFLQVSPFLFLGVSYLMSGFGGRGRVRNLPAVIVVVTVGAIGSMVSSYRPIAPDTTDALEPAMADLVRALEGEGTEGVYSMDALLQWQFMFYGQERIPARFASPVDRRPDLAGAVDGALAAGRPVAIIGMLDQARPILGAALGERVRPIGETFFYIPDVQRPLLESLGFRFQP